MSDSWDSSRRAFIDAARVVRGIVRPCGRTLERPGLGEWMSGPLSASARSRALLTVEEYLARPAKAVDVASAAEYFRATAAEAAGPDVAARGRNAGAALGADPHAAVEEIAARVLKLVEDRDGTELVTSIAGGMRLRDYLPTRTFELAVHTADLCKALDVPANLPDTTAAQALAIVSDLAIPRGLAVSILFAATGRGGLPAAFTVLKTKKRRRREGSTAPGAEAMNQPAKAEGRGVGSLNTHHGPCRIRAAPNLARIETGARAAPPTRPRRRRFPATGRADSLDPSVHCSGKNCRIPCTCRSRFPHRCGPAGLRSPLGGRCKSVAPHWPPRYAGRKGRSRTTGNAFPAAPPMPQPPQEPQRNLQVAKSTTAHGGEGKTSMNLSRCGRTPDHQAHRQSPSQRTATHGPRRQGGTHALAGCWIHAQGDAERGAVHEGAGNRFPAPDFDLADGSVQPTQAAPTRHRTIKGMASRAAAARLRSGAGA